MTDTPSRPCAIPSDTPTDPDEGMPDLLRYPPAAHVNCLLHLAIDEAHSAIVFHDMPADLAARLALRAAAGLAVYHLGESRGVEIAREAFEEATIANARTALGDGAA